MYASDLIMLLCARSPPHTPSQDNVAALSDPISGCSSPAARLHKPQKLQLSPHSTPEEQSPHIADTFGDLDWLYSTERIFPICAHHTIPLRPYAYEDFGTCVTTMCRKQTFCCIECFQCLEACCSHNVATSYRASQADANGSCNEGRRSCSGCSKVHAVMSKPTEEAK